MAANPGRQRTLMQGLLALKRVGGNSRPIRERMRTGR